MYIPDRTNIIWTATDSKGQQASCSFNLFIEPDNIFSEKYEGLRLNFYPNPTSDFFNIEINFPMAEVLIQSMQGKTVQQIKPGGEQLIRINISAFLSGLYLITVKGENGYRKCELQLINN